MRIIAFGFENGVGKDTAGEFLVSKGFTRLSFADSLKRVCSELFNVDLINFHDPAMKEQIISYWGISPRQMMILVGEKMIKGMNDSSFQGENHWIKLLYQKLIQTEGDIVITDLRFKNEYEFLKRQGAVVIKINRGGIRDSSLVPFDYEINNDSTKDILYAKIASVLNL